MIKNITYIFGLLLTLIFYYLFYEHQNSKFLHLNTKLDLISKQIDSSKIKNNTSKKMSVDYKENNIIKNDIVSFSDSLIKLINDKGKIGLTLDSVTSIITESNNNVTDTFCYDLSEQYKIMNFYSNKIRIKKNLTPGSILLSINDSLIHNDVTYILKEINGEGSYIQLLNPFDDTFCKFHKVLQSF